MTDQVNPVVAFKRDLNDLFEKKELALPTNVTPEAFRNAAVVAIQDNPKILGCDKASVFKSIRTLAAAGLVPDGREAALVPFKTKDGDKYVDKCQAMPMVFGLIKMVRRSGEVSDIRAHIVYQKEVDSGRFEYVVGDAESLRHEPILFGERGAPVAAYAIARLKDGSIIREFMSAPEIDTVRRSGSSQRIYKKGEKPQVSDEPIGIWKDWWSEMWKKTVIRRICKRLDMSSEDMRRVMVDQDFEQMRDVTPKSKLAELADRARAAQQPQPEPERHEDGEVEDAEVLPAAEQDAAPVNTSEIDEEAILSDAFPGDPDYDTGAKAFGSGKPFDPKASIHWQGGWLEARRALE